MRAIIACLLPATVHRWEEAIWTLGARLFEAGVVSASFADAVIARERVDPTGLPTTPSVALPHADPAHSLQPALAVGRCAQPIAFGLMGGDGSQTVDAELVFLLASPDPAQHVPTLRRLTSAFGQRGRLAELAALDDPAAIQAAVAELMSGDTPEPASSIQRAETECDAATR